MPTPARSACPEPEEIEEEYQTAIARNVVRELLKDRKSRQLAKKSRSSSRTFSSTFRVSLSRGSLNKVMPRRDCQVGGQEVFRGCFLFSLDM